MNHTSPLPSAEIGLDTLDRPSRAILTLARYRFLSFALDLPDADRRLATQAIRLLPPREAIKIARTLAETVDAMRLARRSCFHFGNPNCRHCAARLTAEERLFISTFAALRAGHPGTARIHALLLCEGNDPTGFLARMDDLCDRFGATCADEPR